MTIKIRQELTDKVNLAVNIFYRVRAEQAKRQTPTYEEKLNYLLPINSN
ncbi:MAG: hypothetical protein ACP5D2_01235 [Candidatus Nanoarchaeia archaeon]